MKKRNFKSLKLNKKSICQLHNSSIKGKGSNQCTDDFQTCYATTRGPFLCDACQP